MANGVSYGQGWIPAPEGLLDIGQLLMNTEAIKTARADREMREAAMEDDRLFREEARAYLSGEDSAMGRILAMDPERGMELIESLEKLDSSGREQRRREAGEIGGLAAYVLQGGTPEEQARRYAAVRERVPEEMRNEMPEQFDPEWVNVQLIKAVGAEEYIEHLMNIETEREKVRGRMSVETERTNRALGVEEARTDRTRETETERTNRALAVEDKRTERALSVEELRTAGRLEVVEAQGEQRYRLEELKQDNGDPALETKDSNAIRSTVTGMFGGIYDPTTREISIADPDKASRALAMMALAEEILAEDRANGGSMGAAGAVAEAQRRMGGSSTPAATGGSTGGGSTGGGSTGGGSSDSDPLGLF